MALLGAIGCRMALAGVSTWDGARFAEVWGTAGWRGGTSPTADLSGGAFTKLVSGVRRLFTGRR